MKSAILATVAFAAVVGLGASSASAQAPGVRDYDAEYTAAIRTAKTAAGFEWLGTLNRLCVLPNTSAGDSRFAPNPETPRTPRFKDDPNAPPRDSWYADATQVFDDLFWLGGKLHSAWLLVDPEGYILIDTEYDYNSEVLVLDGMRKFNLDPMNIKYIIISHAHGDHIGGVELVQDATNDQAIVVMGQGDWDLVNNQPNNFIGETPNPDPSLRIAVPQDGTPVVTTVGSHSVTSFATPPHSPGTISHTFTVHDFGRPVNVMYSGGTAYNFQTNIPDPGLQNLQVYLDSVHRQAEHAEATNATVLLSNHNEFDRAWDRSRMMASRGFGPNPFEVGHDMVMRYFTLMEGCTQAKMIRLEQMAEELKM